MTLAQAREAQARAPPSGWRRTAARPSDSVHIVTLKEFSDEKHGMGQKKEHYPQWARNRKAERDAMDAAAGFTVED